MTKVNSSRLRIKCVPDHASGAACRAARPLEDYEKTCTAGVMTENEGEPFVLRDKMHARAFVLAGDVSCRPAVSAEALTASPPAPDCAALLWGWS
ncbi:hypothetical protein EVAR_84282_1 [Eumeta japonica]|uniref:Uncharacterized protein n=1 Tax=Eumeta variegata TaxID=151549 RepID=A0A4C1WUI5_EUMVA|nr:hypothetical protein EVAR_84282_1 [Eumeta japonica]